MRTVETVVLLVALATMVAAFATRLRVPAPSLLVTVGLLPEAPAVHLPPAVVSLVVRRSLVIVPAAFIASHDDRGIAAFLVGSSLPS